MASLSPRERQILSLVAAGRTSKEIAAKLRISVSTVNWHLSNAFAKLGASSRAEAVALALGAGEVDHASAPRPATRRPAWHGAAAALALVVLGGAIVAGIDAVPITPAGPPRPAATGGAPDVRASPSGEPTPAPARLTASPPAPTGPAMPAIQPDASAPPQPAAVPPLSSPAILPAVPPVPLTTPASIPLPTVTPLPLPTASAVPPPTLPPLPALPLPTLGLP